MIVSVLLFMQSRMEWHRMTRRSPIGMSRWEMATSGLFGMLTAFFAIVFLIAAWMR